MTPQEAVQHLLGGGVLTESEAESVMHTVMRGEASPAQIGALLVLLCQRGERIEEIVGFARAMRNQAETVDAPAGIVFDTCGTGGDATGTFNISTLAALVVAADGICVAKHGNRSVSSQVGSADLLEGLGVRIDLTPAQVGDCLRATGFGFLFAPNHHRAMKHAVAPRRELGVRTVFNLLGPLTNPAGATHQVVGVYDADRVTTLAEVLGRLGVQRALVVHGMDGVDEISCTGPTRVAELQDGAVRERTVHPADFNVSPCRLSDLRGGDLSQNLRIAQTILAGGDGPHRDAVAVNAAAALSIAGRVRDLADGARRARQLLETGAVEATLQRVVAFTRQVATS